MIGIIFCMFKSYIEINFCMFNRYEDPHEVFKFKNDKQTIYGIALLSAAYQGHIGLFKVLLEEEEIKNTTREIILCKFKGSDRDKQTIYSRALFTAAHHGHKGVFKALLEAAL